MEIPLEKKISRFRSIIKKRVEDQRKVEPPLLSERAIKSLKAKSCHSDDYWKAKQSQDWYDVVLYMNGSAFQHDEFDGVIIY